MSQDMTGVEPGTYAPPLAYATPEPRSTRLWAAAIVVGGGLGLIVLGGCFLIGIMMMLTDGLGPTPVPWSPGMSVFCLLLGVLAAGCFIVAASLLVISIGALLRIMRR